MSAPDLARLRLLGLLSGGWLAQGCWVLARLGIPDRLATGSATAAELATATGTDVLALGRLLAALVPAGVLREPEPGRYALSPLGALLRPGVPGSLHDTAIVYGEEVYRAFAGLLDTVRTGRPAFPAQHGVSFYDYLADHPDTAARFAAAMGAARVPPGIAELIPTGARTVVDIGGGDGGLLAEVLGARPELRATLIELPDAAARAQALFATAGLADRVEVVAGSFVDGVPAGADVYLLCRVLHNWADEPAAKVLAQVRAAMPAQAQLIVAEALLPEPGAGRGRGDSATRMVDLLMLAMVEGRDRTASEYRALLAGAGLRVAAVYPPVGTAAESRLVALPAG